MQFKFFHFSFSLLGVLFMKASRISPRLLKILLFLPYHGFSYESFITQRIEVLLGESGNINWKNHSQFLRLTSRLSASLTTVAQKCFCIPSFVFYLVIICTFFNHGLIFYNAVLHQACISSFCKMSWLFPSHFFQITIRINLKRSVAVSKVMTFTETSPNIHIHSRTLILTTSDHVIIVEWILFSTHPVCHLGSF